MNLGLGNLTELKTQLLPEALRADASYDAMLTAIGKGVADSLANYCNRLFGYVADDTYIVSADRIHVYVPRYPFVSVTSVELKTDETAGWVAQTANSIVTKNGESGLIYLGGAMGPHWGHLRFTYTGGYWFDDSEDSSGTLPSGATALPNDLKLAWYLQCKKVWEVNDVLGLKIVPSKENVQLVGLSLAGLEMVPQVKAIADQYIRYAMT